jgi:hypothetical protein
MQNFYKKIKAASQTTGPYQFALKKLTGLDRPQLNCLATGLAWIDWSAPAPTLEANH